MTFRGLGARNWVDKDKGRAWREVKRSPQDCPSRQFLAKQKLAILTASKKVHLGQRPKNDGTSKRWF